MSERDVSRTTGDRFRWTAIRCPSCGMTHDTEGRLPGENCDQCRKPLPADAPCFDPAHTDPPATTLDAKLPTNAVSADNSFDRWWIDRVSRAWASGERG